MKDERSSVGLETSIFSSKGVTLSNTKAATIKKEASSATDNNRLAKGARNTTAGTSFPPVEWSALIEQIKAGEEAGMEQLYKLFNRGIRYYLCRQLGLQDLEDKMHDTFLIVVKAVRRGDLRDPERLMAFVRTIVRRQVATWIDNTVRARRERDDLDAGVYVADHRVDPEQEAIIQQRAELMKSTLSSLSQRDREILVRFYLQEQPQEQICRAMSLTETQFRLSKSRAKAKFGEIGQKKLAGDSSLVFRLKAKAS